MDKSRPRKRAAKTVVKRGPANARAGRVVETAARPRSPLGDAVAWHVIPDTLRALGHSATSIDDYPALEALVLSLVEPLRELERLVPLAERALARDLHAEHALRSTLLSFAASTPPRADARALYAVLLDDDADCDCPPLVARRTPHTNALREGSQRAVIADSINDGLTSPLLREQALTSLLLATARLFDGSCENERADREKALDAVTSLAAASCVMAGLVDAFQRGGRDGVAEHLQSLATRGALPVLRGMSMTMMGMPGMPTMPGAPDIPGFPRTPGIPGGARPFPNDPDLWDDAIAGLLGKLRKPKKWDPNKWDHGYPWWRDPLMYIDPRQTRFIACLLEVRRRIGARAVILPPVRPRRVTWIDGITAITAGGLCVGSTLVIEGTGLLQPGAVLLLPFADGCRAVAVPPGNWTDTRITVTLPAGVISGPIGFGDGGYIAAYEAWAAQQNVLAADIEGLWCHVANISWVGPFRGCPPDLGINRLRAGSAIIDAFTVDGLSSKAVEVGGSASLAWSVRNADTVRIERLGSGPTFAGANFLLNPIGNAWNLTPFNHTSPATYRYRLTATGPCGAVSRDVQIYASRRPNLRIDGIEVTQSIQTTTNSVRLVASKPTVVRVTVRHGLLGFGNNRVAGVTGRILVRRNGTNSGWIDAANGSAPMAPRPGASIIVQNVPQRNNTDDTLNFLIPPNWCTGTVTYHVEVRTNGYGAVGGFAGFDQVVTFTSGAFTFLSRRTLEFRYIRVRWSGTTPTTATCENTLRTAVPLLPTPTANILPLAGVGIQTGSTTANRDDLLDDFDDRHNCSWWEAMWEWLGADCPDDDGAIWVLIPGVFFRGRAYDIPSNVCFTPPGDGPYAAHEIAHCLDQKHVSVMCANGQQATGGDAPSAWPNNAQLQDVPFDVTQNRALTLAGTGVFDLMTYCGTGGNTWPMPARWDRLWNEIGS